MLSLCIVWCLWIYEWVFTKASTLLQHLPFLQAHSKIGLCSLKTWISFLDKSSFARSCSKVHTCSSSESQRMFWRCPRNKFDENLPSGLPVLPCLVYGILRIFLDNTQCWVLPVETEDWVEWIYMAPGLICIMANFIFFVNIFRILVTKLKAPHANEPAHFRYRALPGSLKALGELNSSQKY